MKRRVRTHGAAGAAQVWAVAVAATFVGATACGGLVEGQGADEASLLAGTSGEADVATTTEETLDVGCALARDFPTVDVAPYGQTCAGASAEAARAHYGLADLATGTLDAVQLADVDRVVRALDGTLRAGGLAGGVAAAFPRVVVVRVGAELVAGAPAWRELRAVPQLVDLKGACERAGAEAVTLARTDAPGAILAVCPGAKAASGDAFADTVVHELGHVLDATLADEGSAALARVVGPAAGSAAACPVSAYAEASPREDFAETFVAYAAARGSVVGARAVVERRLAFFDTLVGCVGGAGCAARAEAAFANGGGPAMPEVCPPRGNPGRGGATE